MDLHNSNEGCVEVVCLWLFGIKDLHRVCSSGDGEDGLGERGEGRGGEGEVGGKREGRGRGRGGQGNKRGEGRK